MNANIEKINELMKIIRELHEKIAKLENILEQEGVVWQ